MNQSYFISDDKFLQASHYIYTNFPSWDKILTALVIMAGLYMVARFYQMCKYQFLYGEDFGIRHLRGEISKEEKEYLKRNFSWRNRLK
jgi:hypothetical protein